MKQKTALITGATSGFGKATAEKLHSEGWQLILTGRRKERLEKLKRELPGSEILCFDVQAAQACENAIKGIEKIDLLLNNAGLALGKTDITRGELQDWETMIDTNVKGLLYMTKFCIPLLEKSDNPLIINIGSIAGKEVYPNGNVYCATKYAVDALTQAMRIDLVKKGIKVSQICPGAAETEFSTVRFKGNEEIADKVYNGYSPLLATDIADAISFIVSRPKHVNINDMVIMPAQQASAVLFSKE